MMNRFSLLPLLLVLSLRVSAQDPMSPQATPAAAPYFDPKTIVASAILPTPPADNSDATEKEMEIVLQAQASRTPEQVDRIKLEEHYSVHVFENVTGPWLAAQNAARVPLATNLLARVAETAKPIVVAAKDTWKRPRPFLVNSRVITSIDRPKDPAYPSGHSTRATIDALVLAELMPGEAKAILARGEEIGNDRVIAGVHYPSDVLAGRKLGRAVFDQLMGEKPFRDDLKAARTELEDVMKRGQ